MDKKKKIILIGSPSIGMTVAREILKFRNEKNLEILIDEYLKFSLVQFPKSTADSSIEGLKREIKEVELALDDYHVIDGHETRKALGLEYIDCFMYLIHSFTKSGFSIDDLKYLFEKKLEINKNRKWKLNEDGSYSHVKTEK